MPIALRSQHGYPSHNKLTMADFSMLKICCRIKQAKAKNKLEVAHWPLASTCVLFSRYILILHDSVPGTMEKGHYNRKLEL